MNIYIMYDIFKCDEGYIESLVNKVLFISVDKDKFNKRTAKMPNNRTSVAVVKTDDLKYITLYICFDETTTLNEAFVFRNKIRMVGRARKIKKYIEHCDGFRIAKVKLCGQIKLSNNLDIQYE